MKFQFVEVQLRDYLEYPFSGELAYEIAVPTRYGDSLMRVLMEAGEEFNVIPYGTEGIRSDAYRERSRSWS